MPAVKPIRRRSASSHSSTFVNEPEVGAWYEWRELVSKTLHTLVAVPWAGRSHPVRSEGGSGWQMLLSVRNLGIDQQGEE